MSRADPYPNRGSSSLNSQTNDVFIRSTGRDVMFSAPILKNSILFKTRENTSKKKKKKKRKEKKRKGKERKKKIHCNAKPTYT